MPTYEYRCKKGHTFERLQKITDPPLRRCPQCGVGVERLIGAGAGLIFKGSGFYITDYKKPKSQPKKPEGSPSEGQPAPIKKDLAAKTDAKPK